MSIFDRTLHIPAEQLYFKPRAALHERVLLPLSARPSARFYAAVMLAGLAALACCLLGYEMASARDTDGGARLFAFVFFVAGALPAAVAATGIRDAMRQTPFLHVDAAGLYDTRVSSTTIAWVDVTKAELIASASGVLAVRLTMSADRPSSFNPFRFGGWDAVWRDRRRTYLISLALLDVRAHTLAQTMLALAARNGATIEQP